VHFQQKKKLSFRNQSKKEDPEKAKPRQAPQVHELRVTSSYQFTFLGVIRIRNCARWSTEKGTRFLTVEPGKNEESENRRKGLPVKVVIPAVDTGDKRRTARETVANERK